MEQHQQLDSQFDSAEIDSAEIDSPQIDSPQIDSPQMEASSIDAHDSHDSHNNGFESPHTSEKQTNGAHAGGPQAPEAAKKPHESDQHVEFDTDPRNVAAKEKWRTAPLVERLDPALGEATTGIGAILTEFVRQTLRNGVQKIDEELQGQVKAKVDLAVDEKMPEIEEAASETASTTAHQVASEKVSELGHEVKATTDRLENDIAESEKRANATAQELIDDRIVTLRKKSKATAELFQSQIKELQEKTHDLGVQFENQHGQQQQIDQAIRDQLTLEAESRENLRLVSQQLDARVAELEKPRGFRKWFGFLFRKKK